MPRKNNLTPDGIVRGVLRGKATQRQQFLNRQMARWYDALRPVETKYGVPVTVLVQAFADVGKAEYDRGYQVGFASGRRARKDIAA